MSALSENDRRIAVELGDLLVEAGPAARAELQQGLSEAIRSETLSGQQAGLATLLVAAIDRLDGGTDPRDFLPWALETVAKRNGARGTIPWEQGSPPA